MAFVQDGNRSNAARHIFLTNAENIGVWLLAAFHAIGTHKTWLKIASYQLLMHTESPRNGNSHACEKNPLEYFQNACYRILDRSSRAKHFFNVWQHTKITQGCNSS
eukprot:6181647-Pleurochrysis_carterae.AAC.1